jgi:hypothetical protein
MKNTLVRKNGLVKTVPGYNRILNRDYFKIRHILHPKNNLADEHTN